MVLSTSKQVFKLIQQFLNEQKINGKYFLLILFEV